MRFFLNRELVIVAAFNLLLSPAWGACVKPPASAQKMNQFKLNPQGLIPSADSETRAVEIQTRELAGTDPRLAESLVRVAETANPKFQTAIAAGLAQAALACENTDQQAAEQIQQAVAGFQNGEFQASFAAVAGDIETAATAAAGSAGSVVITNPNRSKGASGVPTYGGGTPTTIVINATPAGTQTTTVFSVAGPSSSQGGGATAADPVSPTR
ncbi:hypothetical protein [Bradyrhizobium sp.]|jgi:hypothetical protein|uniref:hypothetical protein n=1 Tax=Bradyrhizobium sp. TaxID=376 RepID=UPI003C1AC125